MPFPKPEDGRYPRGVILGTVRYDGIATDSRSPWAIPGQKHWLLRDPLPCAEPIPKSGALGLWPVPDGIVLPGGNQ